MARTLGNTIADSLALSLNYSERLRQGIAAESFARFASPGGVTIASNHPAFVFGHLSLYAPRIVAQLERSDLVQEAPSTFSERFSKDALCVDDHDGSVYPTQAEVLTFFDAAYANALRALREADEAILQRPNPTSGRMAELFPTLGSMHAFYVGGHMMLHLGQISAWRRMQGLGPA